jgi:LysR substrate binding domain-containing protein
VPLRIYVEALGGAIRPIVDGRCSIGIISSLPVIPDTLTNERLPGIAFFMVAAHDHPLASYKGNIPKEVLGKHTQIVLTDRSDLSSGREFGVMSPTTWRLADLFAKHHFLLNGLGWGGMPLHAVRKDLEEGRLVVLPIEDVPPDGLILLMSVVWQTKSPPGPAGRWFIEHLKQTPVSVGKVPKPPVRRKNATAGQSLSLGLATSARFPKFVIAATPFATFGKSWAGSDSRLAPQGLQIGGISLARCFGMTISIALPACCRLPRTQHRMFALPSANLR